jgi:hypothetical protein
MGEAKRRKQADPDRYRFRSPDRETFSMFEKEGNPLNVVMVGAGVILAKALSRSIDLDAPDPESAAVRRAFGLWDRIRTGEVETWPCALCETQHVGLGDLSCFGVITPLGATPKTKGIIVAICQRCDSASAEHTMRQITAMFPMSDAGRA